MTKYIYFSFIFRRKLFIQNISIYKNQISDKNYFGYKYLKFSRFVVKQPFAGYPGDFHFIQLVKILNTHKELVQISIFLHPSTQTNYQLWKMYLTMHVVINKIKKIIITIRNIFFIENYCF